MLYYFTQTAEYARVFPHGHKENSAVQRQLLGANSKPPAVSKASLLQYYHWECILPAGNMPSIQQQKELTCLRDQMTGSSTSPVSEPSQRYAIKVIIRDMLSADDAAVATHAQEELQSLMTCFSMARKDFGLTISLKKDECPGTGHRSTARHR